MSQELVNSVNKLTDETSALLQEYVKGNTVLQNSASDAASSAAAAKASETNSVNQANIATQKAAEAKVSEQNAAAIVTGGTATIDPSPGKIPLANSQGKISSGWLTALAFARTKADMDAMRASVNRQCAASGMIHAGKAERGLMVNEGMWTISDATLPNVLLLGRSSLGDRVGQSETDYPVFSLSGFPVQFRAVNSTGEWTPLVAKFPQAPDGTDIYDSSGNCRGTGKPTLNLLTEVDPKYEDVAPNVNEAVARAFEGVVKNGDFRNGQSAWVGTGSITNNEMILGSGQYLWQTTSAYHDISATKDYIVEVVATDVVGTVEASIYADANKAFYRTLSNGLNVFNITDFTFNFGVTADYVRLSASSGASAKILSVSVREVTEEVVTERVDLSGLEGYLEEITPAKPYIYPYGGINNQATSVDGIATTVDNVRPITYFANFDGDTTSRGRGWNLNDLTDAQLLTILQNPYHHVYVIDGKLVQFRVRPRTIAGAGNGDWSNTDTTSIRKWLEFKAVEGLYVRAQGYNESGPSFSSSGYGYNTDESRPQLQGRLHTGVFTSYSTSSAYNGECYFYVLATVLRLNQGAYHPSFNPLGTKKWQKQSALGANSWHQGDVGDNLVKSIAFNQTLTTGVVGARENTGAIGQDSGRPDGKFYDAIYPDGAGGVIDRRLSAFPITMEDYFKAMAKAENGTMRGMEKLVETAATPYEFTIVNFYNGATYVGLGSNNTPLEFRDWVLDPINSGRKAWIYLDGEKFECIASGSDVGNGTFWYLAHRYGDLRTRLGNAVNKYIVLSREVNLSVSGNFLQTDVIGHPANILQVGALKNGWVGSWIPELGTGTKTLTRKSLVASAKVVWTTNLGGSWSSGDSWGIDLVTNKSVNSVDPSLAIVIASYPAAAKVTKPSSASKVYGYKKGLGSVITTQDYRTDKGALLAESLMGQVLTSNASGKRYGSCPLTSDLVGLSGRLYTVAGYLPEHQPIMMSQPNNSSPAIKILPHAVSENGQATLGFAWNELKHNGTNWGDDGTMLVIDNTGTYNNLNGEACLYGYAVSALPIGWVDNHARFGAQVPGVDL
ncbi:hypothetical protein BOO91_14720 [Vibrio navarrensis]|uniref:hypothetical protein n=1 Tax=Vibrio navarrensis TaxID=29495 RepID=UPI00186693F7|nr:hypothetical protein [Vibrio navarrensis]MBE3662184.1 hypothetical protein [Vibrio navarrensis]